MFLIYTITWSVLWIPVVALLLWPGTLVTNSLDFSWLFAVIGGIILSLLTVLVIGENK